MCQFYSHNAIKRVHSQPLWIQPIFPFRKFHFLPFQYATAIDSITTNYYQLPQSSTRNHWMTPKNLNILNRCWKFWTQLILVPFRIWIRSLSDQIGINSNIWILEKFSNLWQWRAKIFLVGVGFVINILNAVRFLQCRGLNMEYVCHSIQQVVGHFQTSMLLLIFKQIF